MHNSTESKTQSDLVKALSNDFGQLAQMYYMSDISGLEESLLVEVSASFSEGSSLGEIKKHVQSLGIPLSLKDIKSILVVDAYHSKPNGVTFQSSAGFTING